MPQPQPQTPLVTFGDRFARSRDSTLTRPARLRRAGRSNLLPTTRTPADPKSTPWRSHDSTGLHTSTRRVSRTSCVRIAKPRRVISVAWISWVVWKTKGKTNGGLHGSRAYENSSRALSARISFWCQKKHSSCRVLQQGRTSTQRRVIAALSTTLTSAYFEKRLTRLDSPRRVSSRPPNATRLASARNLRCALCPSSTGRGCIRENG